MKSIFKTLLPTLGNFLVNPINLLLCLGILAGIFYFLGYNKLYKGFLGVAVLWVLIICTSPIPRMLVTSIENGYPPLRLENHRKLAGKNLPVVVLGAGFTNDTNLLPTQQLSNKLLGRLVEGYRLYNQLPQSRLVSSGPKSNDITAQAKMVANAAVDLGVQPKDTFLLTQVHNTASEARNFARRFPETDTVIIATNAIHMPRAMYWFRHYKKTPIPAPTNYLVKYDAYEAGLNFSIGLDNVKIMGKAMHEYAGLWYARWKTGE